MQCKNYWSNGNCFRSDGDVPPTDLVFVLALAPLAANYAFSFQSQSKFKKCTKKNSKNREKPEETLKARISISLENNLIDDMFHNFNVHFSEVHNRHHSHRHFNYTIRTSRLTFASESTASTEIITRPSTISVTQSTTSYGNHINNEHYNHIWDTDYTTYMDTHKSSYIHLKTEECNHNIENTDQYGYNQHILCLHRDRRVLHHQRRNNPPYLLGYSQDIQCLHQDRSAPHHQRWYRQRLPQVHRQDRSRHQCQERHSRDILPLHRRRDRQTAYSD